MICALKFFIKIFLSFVLLCVKVPFDSKNFFLTPDKHHTTHQVLQIHIRPIEARWKLKLIIKSFIFILPLRISKATNFRPKQWTQKWTIVQRPFSKSQHQHGATKNQSNNPNANGKGKLHKIKRKWRWGAGAGWTILSVLDWWLLAAGGWLSWQGTVLRWTPLGVVLAAAASWHMHNRECDGKGLPRTAPHWQVKFANFHPTTRDSKTSKNKKKLSHDRRASTVHFHYDSWAEVGVGSLSAPFLRLFDQLSMAFTLPRSVSTWRKLWFLIWSMLKI